ncbi:MAG TPA: pantetheine-phosphate adenylyltransferase [Acidisoma sp.]|jgi:pantetheine-phosphate adenylyltransferase|uniref:pantetheine-phosphate adenylyltransferase n=1 Tax=Acidisoma sp. TaxID=1872115 RepID=UPI002B6E70EF|nr:pantetheine-phosphate adenylyltransferase [Acidisoma sp.]HTI03186.1 pantetheine-phosphate adenylyltransferase [Acidisoma sp.]
MAAREKIGVYPGTFDPITNGHLDIIARGAKLVDRLVVAVAASSGKNPVAELDERVALTREVLAETAQETGTIIEVRPFSTLLVQFTREVGASVILRGLRAISDFDFEFQLAGMNYRLDPSIETVFLMASERHQFISSRFVKEIALLGGDVSSFVPPLTERHLDAWVKKQREP